MNMYTRPKYRRMGVAYKTLDMLIQDIKSRGVTAVSLEAIAMGRPLYEKYGFVKMNEEMEKKQLLQLIKAIFVMVLCVPMAACGSEGNAYFEGLYLYVDGIKYTETSGLYEESDTVIAKTNDDYTIYEIEGDSLHNYAVARSFLDQTLYVREDYTKDRTIIEGICFDKSTSEYICEQDFIEAFSKALLECDKNLEIDDDTLASLRKTGIGVYVKYANDNVGE